MSESIGLNKTQVDATAQFKLGTLVTDIGTSGPAKTYKYIQYLEGAAAVDGVAGEVAFYPTPAVDTTVSGNIVTSDLSDSIEVGAGVLQATMSNLEYGWIQVSGIATLSIALSEGADGDPLTPTGAADGTLDVTAAATSAVCAYALDASANIIMCAFPH